MFQITPIPALQDNYIWAIHNELGVFVVDPGEAEPVLRFLAARNLPLLGILCTHRHHDHVDGIEELRGVYNVEVYGRSHPKNPHITRDLREGDHLVLKEVDLGFNIMELPGHLEDHIAFVGPGMVFCGDVMFGAGCGRNFEGTLAQLLHSLKRLAALPDETKVYCAHEYAVYTLPFAQSCEPDNPDLQRRIKESRALIEQGLPTVPSTIAVEKSTNPYLRCTNPALIRKLQNDGMTDTSELAVFTALNR
jgi:hydroxyacylglutathione hydrolase